MQNLKSKLFEDIKSQTEHKINQLTLDDLIDPFLLKKEFNLNNSFFKNFLQEELASEEEEETTQLIQMELLKRDMLLNFTNSHIGKEIPNMSNNHIFDKFNCEYNSSYHNEFQTKVASTTNFLLSIFLNLATTEIEKSKILNLLSKLQEEMGKDSVAQQKFFTVFSIVNNLVKILTIEKNFQEFFKLIDAYTKFLINFVKDSRFTVYLVKDHIVELANLIVEKIINEQNEEDVKDQGVGALFKLAVCFKLPDLYLNFTESLLRIGKFRINLKEELNEFIKDLFDVSLDIFSSVSENTYFGFNDNENIKLDKTASFATDGVYVYIHQNTIGLYKVGTGLNNTIKGKVYSENKTFFNKTSGSLAYCCGRLYFRSSETAPNPFVLVNVNDLALIERNLLNNHFFVDKESSPVNLQYNLQGHKLINTSRSTESSKLISDGRNLYIVSIIGELTTTEEEFKTLYPNNCLISIDVFDPLDNYNLITSFPIVDPRNILGHSKTASLVDSFANSIVTDGRTIYFIQEEPIKFSIINRAITEVVKDLPQNENKKIFLDSKNSLLWALNLNSTEETSLQYSKIKLNTFITGLIGDYPGLKSFNYFNLKETATSIYEPDILSNIFHNTTQAVKEKEVELYEFFFKEKSKITKKEDSCTNLEINTIISLVLNSLGQSAMYNQNPKELSSEDILSHIFSLHTLNLNSSTIQKLLKLYGHYKKSFFDDSNLNIESKYFIISAFFKLFNAILRQIQILRFNEFKSFKEDFGCLREIVEDSIHILIEFYISGDHFEGLTIDLISQSLQIAENYTRIFSIDFPNLNMLVEMITKNSENFADLNNTIIRAAGNSGKSLYSSKNMENLLKILEIILTKNNNLVNEAISGFLDTSSESETISENVCYNKNFENLVTPMFKIIFNTHLEITKCKDEQEKNSKLNEFNELVCSFEKLFSFLSGHISKLIKGIDIKFANSKFTSAAKFEMIAEKISQFINKNSYAYRFYFASISFLNIFTDEKIVIFKTWHYVYETLILFDRSLNQNKKTFLELKQKEKEQEDNLAEPKQEEFHLEIETPHPITKEIKINKEYIFKNQSSDIFIEFDPISFKDEKTEFELSLKTKSSEVSFSFTNGYEDKHYSDVKSITVSIKAPPATSYGFKCLIHNQKKYNHYFNSLRNLVTAVITRSIKTFFFFNYNSVDKLEKSVEDLLQSKLFEGGINELLDLETSSEEYKQFVCTLKSSNNYLNFEKRLLQESEERDEVVLPPFDIEEIIGKENLYVEKFIRYAQASLKMRFPWINIGGDKADKIVRAAFAVFVKQERMYEMIVEVVDKISEEEEKREHNGCYTDLTTKELSEIENFEFLLLSWSEVSRLRQWHQEQIKDLAEANSDDFDKRNEDFVRSVLDKCKFLFTVNPPKGKGKRKKTNINFLHIFAQNQILSSLKIDNDVARSNMIKFKKSIMHGKIEEGKSETENLKKIVTSLTNCIKLTKVSIDSLRNALRIVNTRAKFREIALSLINSLLCEIESDDVKLIIVKQIIHTLRKTSGKRLISIDDEIKSGSSTLMSAIKLKFHNFIQIIFANLLKSESIYKISGYLDCLYWNLSARNQVVLLDINLLNNLFLHSPNLIIKNVWNKITKIGNKNIASKKSNRYEFNENSLGVQLLEFFNIYSSMIIGRIIDETHSTENVESQPNTGFLRMKSSVFDNSFDELVKSICDILSTKINEYISNYQELNSNPQEYLEKFLPEEKYENFSSKYFDENLLNSFLLLLYKFIINQSSLVIKHMKNPEFLASMFVLLRYTSSKNRFTLCNILKVYLTNLSEEDIHNIVFFLKKQELFLSVKYHEINHHEEKFIPKIFLITYLLNIVSELRGGIYSEDKISLSSQYEESAYIVALLKSIYNEEKWRGSFETVFCDFLERDVLISPMLAVLNGDFGDFHYGSYIAVKYKSNKPKTITELMQEKSEEKISCTYGHILGFCDSEEKISELKTKKEFKEFFCNKLKFRREEDEKFVLIMALSNDSYNKNKLKDNDVEFQVRNINEIILVPNNEIKINCDKLGQEIVKRFQEKLKLIKSGEYSYLDYYLLVQLGKSLNSIYNEEISKDLQELLMRSINVEDIKSLLDESSKSTFVNNTACQFKFINMLKLYLDNKPSTNLILSKAIKKHKETISIEALRFSRSIRLYKGDLTNSKIFKILSTNLTIDTDSFKKLDQFQFVRLGDSSVKKYLNCLIYCIANEELLENIKKIDDINIVFMLPREDSLYAKANIIHPYIIINAEKKEIDDLLTNFENKINVSSFKELDIEKEEANLAQLNMSKESIIALRNLNLNVKDGDSKENDSIAYTPAFDFDKNEIISTNLSVMNTTSQSFSENDFRQILQNLALHYLRTFLVNFISTNIQLVFPENYEFISKQFKLVFFDNCQSSILTWFDYSRFKNLISLFATLVEKETELRSLSVDKSILISFIEITTKSKVFNSYNFSLAEVEIQNYIQTELLELYLKKQNEYSSANCRESYIQAIAKTINISLITVNNEYEIFNQYLLKSRDLLNEYARFIASQEDRSLKEFEDDLKLIEIKGLTKLAVFLNASIIEEKSFSSRTKILFNFIWEFGLIISDIYRKVFREEKFYSYQSSRNIGKLKICLEQMNLLYYKTRDENLKNDSILSIEDLRKQLTSEIEVICNSKYIFEKKLDFSKVTKYNLESNNQESKGKIYITAKKSTDGTFKVSDIIGDDEKLSFKLTKEENLLIANKDQCTNELWMCGYNEKRRMGNPALSDYEYVYVPIQCKIEGNVRIRKVLNIYQSTIVLTYDNRIYVAGEGTNSGLGSQSTTFTLENQWNEIAKKENIIDMYANENMAFVMVTNKNTYVSGYNGSNIFGTIVASGNYTNGITKLSTPFKSNKVLQVSLGYSHLMFLIDDGSAYGMGCNSCYELNLETNTVITQLTKIPFPQGMKPTRISCGYNSSLFLMKERDNKVYLYSCGDNGYGQNGQGTTSTKRFKKCLGVEDIQWKYIKMGYYCSCGITADNKLYTWGYNGYYNLSHPDTNYHYQPDLVEFYKDMTVLDADINERNLVVRCIDTDGQMKVFSAGYNGYACMGIGSTIESYNKVPLEVTTFKDSFIQKVFLTGSAFNVSFIKTNISAIANSFEFKCNICEKVSNEALHVLPKEGKNTKICNTCLKSDLFVADGICYAIRSINIACCKDGNLDSLVLPDLSYLYALTESKLEHTISCYDCKKLIGKSPAYISAHKMKNNTVAFCEECYSNTAYFEVPVFVYCLKYAIDYSALPDLDSVALLNHDMSNKLKLSSLKNLNEEGLKEFYKENESVIEKIFKEFDEIKSEHILEYLKLTEIEDKEKSISEEIKKVPCLEKLTESQLKIIQMTIAKLDVSMKGARNFVSMDISNIIKEIYISNLNYLSKISRMDLLDKLIYEGTTEISSDTCRVDISRGKSIKFKQRAHVDCQGIYTIFGQIFNEVKKIPLTQYNCKKNNRLFRVYLKGEGATDAGGPYREMINVLCDELQSAYLDLLIPTANNRSSSGQDREKWTINPTAKSNLHLEMFKTIGRFFAFAIRSTGYLNLNLPSFIWKQILNQPLDIQDLEKIDIHTANFLSDLRHLEEKGIDEKQFEYIYDQQFSTILSNGKEVELMSGGNEKKLTYSNAKEYVKIVLKTRFEECAVQIEAIKAGEVINPEITLFLNWKELEEKVCGNLIVDVDWLKKNTVYESWNENDQIITWFWQAFRKFTNDERILYLKFVWGRSRLPLTEDAYYHKHKITKAYSNHQDISLPLSHTCYFTIDIPPYSSFDILYKKLLYAIRFCSEIDNDNTPGEALEDL